MIKNTNKEDSAWKKRLILLVSLVIIAAVAQFTAAPAAQGITRELEMDMAAITLTLQIKPLSPV